MSVPVIKLLVLRCKLTPLNPALWCWGWDFANHAAAWPPGSLRGYARGGTRDRWQDWGTEQGGFFPSCLFCLGFLFVSFLFPITVQYFFPLASAIYLHNNSWILSVSFPTRTVLGYGTSSETSAPAVLPPQESAFQLHRVFPLSLKGSNLFIYIFFWGGARPRSVVASYNWYLCDILMQW